MSTRTRTTAVGPIVSVIADIRRASSTPPAPEPDLFVTADTPTDQLAELITTAIEDYRGLPGHHCNEVEAQHAAENTLRIVRALVSGTPCGYTLSRGERAEGIAASRVHGIAGNRLRRAAAILTPDEAFPRAARVGAAALLLIWMTAVLDTLGWSDAFTPGRSRTELTAAALDVTRTDTVPYVTLGAGALVLLGAAALMAATVRIPRPHLHRVLSWLDAITFLAAMTTLAAVFGAIAITMFPAWTIVPR
ncbi:MAG: hypothetical protein WBD41_17745 [Rhodococcus sp. (in: high G+C Gram-positive bacteria)]